MKKLYTFDRTNCGYITSKLCSVGIFENKGYNFLKYDLTSFTLY